MNRLKESVGQANHVLLNMATCYSLGTLYQKVFRVKSVGYEVMLFKGAKVIVVTRRTVTDKMFFNTFTKKYSK